VEGEGERFVVRQDGEVPGLQHVTEVLRGFINRQEFSVIGAVLLLGRAQLSGEKGEGLRDVLHSVGGRQPWRWLKKSVTRARGAFGSG